MSPTFQNNTMISALGPVLGLVFCMVCQIHGQQGSVCLSLEYRNLPIELQNEHRCMILETIQRDFEDDRNSRTAILNDIIRRIDKLNKKVSRIRKSDKKEKPLKFSPTLSGIPLIRDCHELLMTGTTVSGVYPIRLPLGRIVNVYCDMNTENGGWTVIQRRQDGSINFTQNWDNYAFGFGNVNSEYWFGNENIFQMTSYQNYTLRFDMYGWEENDTAYAEYSMFYISGEEDGYRLNIGGYRGTAGDSLQSHNNMRFSTIDRDQDRWRMSCATKDGAGWWYNDCGYTSLNGVYQHTPNTDITRNRIIKGIIWYHWKMRYLFSIKKLVIKIKPTLALKIERELMAARIRTTTEMFNTTTSGNESVSEEEGHGEEPEVPMVTTQTPELTTPIRRRRIRTTQWPPLREYGDDDLYEYFDEDV